jgi:16S rRNA (uracil1498-N3)-methyltransferase
MFKSKRYKIGDQLFFLDGNGSKKLVEIISTTPPKFKLIKDIVETKPNKNISIAISMLKGDALDLAIENIVCLGANEIILFESNRSIAKIRNLEQLQKYLDKNIIEAQKLSRDAHFTKGIVSFNNTKITSSNIHNLFKNYDSVVVFHENVTNTNLNISNKTLFLFGPEGGFDENEITNFIKSNNCKILSLGKNILRTPLAISYALSKFK